jgi:hypothetical protein
VDEGRVGEEEAGGAAGQWRSGAVFVVGSAHGYLWELIEAR